MLDPHTTYNVGPTMSTISQDVWVFCISKDSPATLPINYVHLLPAIYYICSPCAAAILRSRFRNNCFDWILEEFSWWAHPWSLQASLDNFLLSAEIVRASLLECIGRCASLHIWCQCCLIFFLQNQLRIENTEHHCWHALNVLPFCIFYITNSPNTKVNTVWVFSTAAHCCFLKK